MVNTPFFACARNLHHSRRTPAPDRIVLTLIPSRRSSSKPWVFQRQLQLVSLVEMENKRQARPDEQCLQFRVRRGPNEGVYQFDQLLQEDHLAIKVRLVELVSFDCIEPRKVVVALLRERIANPTSLWSRCESLHQSSGFLVDLSMLVNHPIREESYASRLRSAQGCLAGRDFRLIRHKDDTDDLCIGQTCLLAKCANCRCEEQHQCSSGTFNVHCSPQIRVPVLNAPITERVYNTVDMLRFLDGYMRVTMPVEVPHPAGFIELRGQQPTQNS
jgi:hypothetical protein